MSSKTSIRPVLVLAANTPWVYALAQGLADHSSVTALRFYDNANYRRLRPRWPEEVSQVKRSSVVMPRGYAGTLEPLFRPLMKRIVIRNQQRLKKLGGSSPIVVAPYPYLLPWVSSVPPDRLVYFNLDEYSFYDPRRAERILRQERELVARSGLTLCLSVHQVETLQKRNPDHAERIKHFPLGVVEDFLNPEPQRTLLPMTVGYVGNLSDRVDWELVASVAGIMPDVEFIFVGSLDSKYSGCHHKPDWLRARERALSMSNIKYEGEVSQENVRAHYWRHGINWMPYDSSHGFNIAACPTKIMDALASGRPFVSTYIPEVNLYPEWITVATSAEAVANSLTRIFSKASTHDPNAQVAFARTQTWSIRALEFLKVVKR